MSKRLRYAGLAAHFPLCTSERWPRYTLREYIPEKFYSSPDYKSDIFQATATSATVTFTLKKAEFFDFSLEPANNATLPLNSVSPEGAQLLPLTITAQLFDSQKQPLNPAPIYGRKITIYGNTQICQSGAPLNVNFQAHPSNIGKYIGQVMALDTAGAYSLTVQLAPRTPDSLYQPLRQSQTVTFNRTRVDPFDMQVLAPQDKDKLSLHEQGFGAAIGRLTSPSCSDSVY